MIEVAFWVVFFAGLVGLGLLPLVIEERERRELERLRWEYRMDKDD